MKKVLTLSISIMFIFSASVFGQLENTKEKMKEKAESRVEDKVDEGIDKTLDAVEDGIMGLFESKEEKNEDEDSE